MITVDPVRYYQVGQEQCVLKSVMLIQVAATNATAIAAVTGKRLRIMGFSFTANAAATNPGIVLKDGSGGTTKYAVTIPALTVGEHARPVIDAGYFETTVSTGLFLDVITSTANLFINYIEYTP
jgi:hypothetical protein